MYSAINHSHNFNSSINNNSNNFLLHQKTESISSIGYYYATNKNISAVKEINKECINRSNKFNPFQMQSISFNWSDFKFYFQFDVLASMWFVMQNRNFIPEQKQLFK